MTNLAKYIPLNPIEHENELRTIILKHMGSTQGNPTQWVVNAVAEAFQQGFGVGFDAGTMARVSKPPPPPAYQVQMPVAERVNPESDPRRLEARREKMKSLGYDVTDVEPKP